MLAKEGISSATLPGHCIATASYVQCLEKVQRNATRCVFGITPGVAVMLVGTTPDTTVRDVHIMLENFRNNRNLKT